MMEELKKELEDLIREAEVTGCIDDPEIQELIAEVEICIKNGDHAGCKKILDKLRNRINTNIQKKGKGFKK
jgi:hypothetical protein